MFVIVDQFIDRTVAREKTFFDTGVVAHVSMARPVCSRLITAREHRDPKVVDRLTAIAGRVLQA